MRNQVIRSEFMSTVKQRGQLVNVVCFCDSCVASVPPSTNETDCEQTNIGVTTIAMLINEILRKRTTAAPILNSPTMFAMSNFKFPTGPTNINFKT